MTAEDAQGRIIDGLAETLAVGGAKIERIATHGAVVLLAGEYAYKIKRQVKYPYMDFSTLGLREWACRAELRVNRRTAPGLYLDAVPIRRDVAGRIGLGSEGEIVEWAVKMRRFDEDGLFDRLAQAGRLEEGLIHRLAAAIARFHAAAERISGSDPVATMRALVTTNRDRLIEHELLFEPALVQSVTRKALAFIESRADALAARDRLGFVRHCHGDLHLGNVTLIEGEPALFDAIEFNPAFAEIDVLYDLAFMLMDLEHRRLRRLANAFFSAYLEESEDWDGLALLPLYLSTRAAIRAHVGAAAAALDADPVRAESRRREAKAYLKQADRYLDPAAPALVAVGGVSGTGKSTLARLLAPALGPAPGAVVLRSDVVRKKLFGIAPTERLPKEGYAPGVSDRVFQRMAAVASRIFGAGHAAIADAVYGEERHRRQIRAAAAKAGVHFVGLWLEAGRALLERRIEARRDDASDATVAVLHSQLDHVAAPTDWIRIDASADPEEVARAARERLPSAGIRVLASDEAGSTIG